MSSAILDISEAGFIRIQEKQSYGSIIKFKDRVTLWQHYTFLATSSLIAKSCQSAVLLAGLSLPMQHMAFQLGENIGYLQQVCGIPTYSGFECVLIVANKVKF